MKEYFDSPPSFHLCLTNLVPLVSVLDACPCCGDTNVSCLLHIAGSFVDTHKCPQYSRFCSHTIARLSLKSSSTPLRDALHHSAGLNVMDDSVVRVRYLGVRFAFEKLWRFHEEPKLRHSIDIYMSEMVNVVVSL